MAKDDRKLTGTLAVPYTPEPGTKFVGAQMRYFGPNDDPDEVQEHLTKEEVERHSQPDPDTGKALLEGKWTGKLKERLPMAGSKRAKATLQAQEQVKAVHAAKSHGKAE